MKLDKKLTNQQPGSQQTFDKISNKTEMINTLQQSRFTDKLQGIQSTIT